MREAGITTRLRACRCLAQLGHESSDLLYMQEIRDRNYSIKYEGRQVLGNTRPGGGPRYNGRGSIQLMGQDNYRAAGRDLGLPLEQNPEKAADPDGASSEHRGLVLDKPQLQQVRRRWGAGLREVTKLINGGYNGLDDRERRCSNCKRVPPEPFTPGKGEEQEDMPFERVVFGRVTHADGELAHPAAAIPHRHDVVRCTVADAGNIKATIAACQCEEWAGANASRSARPRRTRSPTSPRRT
jgi:predicted chitinase